MLLCNYFLFLGKKAWVVLETAIPEGEDTVTLPLTLPPSLSPLSPSLSLGPTAYVLTPHPVSRRSYILWNPSTGKHFPYNLSHIPLHSIGCLINNENVSELELRKISSFTVHVLAVLRTTCTVYVCSNYDHLLIIACVTGWVLNLHYCVQVWGNVQEWDHPGRLTFDLQNCKKWCPLFSSSVKPLDSLQVKDIMYCTM